MPLFPLTGVLLLPGNYLPLNVFEPRYRNLVEDALAGPRRVGMVQPRSPGATGPAGAPGAAEAPPVFEVGCLGRIARCEPQPDGRFLILLEGEHRFRIESELPPLRGYRRAVAGFAEFAADTAGEEDGAGGRELLAAALDFAERFELDFDRDLLASLAPLRLLNVLAASLPFGVLEKQALLEAPTALERQRVLLALMRMTPDGAGEADSEVAPVVH